MLASGEDIYSGHPYVFLSKRRNRVKILSYDKGGFVLWYRRGAWARRMGAAHERDE